MDLSLTDEQEALREAVGRLLAKESSPERVRGAEPLGYDPGVWQALVDMGVPTMGVDPDLGGSGATLADLAVVAHQCGIYLAPVPAVEAMVANRLIARLGGAVDHTLITTMAVRPAVGHVARLVPGGAVADIIVGLMGDEVRLLTRGVVTSGTGTVHNLGNAPLDDIDLADAEVLAQGPLAVAAYATALNEWRALTALWLHGLGRAALDIGVQYAKDRHQFGVAIGSFQAVQHRLADLHTDLDGAWLLANKAVWALDEAEPIAAEFASMAFTFAGETAQAAAAAALHYHGGYGFMEEYDIQLYFRRAKAARLILGDPRRELQHLADTLWGAPGADEGEG